MPPPHEHIFLFPLSMHQRKGWIAKCVIVHLLPMITNQGSDLKYSFVLLILSSLNVNIIWEIDCLFYGQNRMASAVQIYEGNMSGVDTTEDWLWFTPFLNCEASKGAFRVRNSSFCEEEEKQIAFHSSNPLFFFSFFFLIFDHSGKKRGKLQRLTASAMTNSLVQLLFFSFVLVLS